MAKVEIQVNGRPYVVACDDGQEARVRELGAYVDKRLREVASGSSASEAQLLLLTSLILADEVMDRAADQSGETEELLVAAVDHLTTRVQAIAARLEPP